MLQKAISIKDKTIIQFLLLSILIMHSHSAFSQRTDALETEGGIGGMKAGLAYYLGGKYTSNMNPYIGLSFGAKLNYAYVSEDIGGHYFNGKTSALIGTLGAKFSTPCFKYFGLTGDLDFMFEPIPWNVFTLRSGDEDHETGSIYNGFNPGISAQLGFFYEKNNSRFVLGSGISNYNPFCPYYKYEHVPVPRNDYLISIFIRIYGLME